MCKLSGSKSNCQLLGLYKVVLFCKLKLYRRMRMLISLCIGFFSQARPKGPSRRGGLVLQLCREAHARRAGRARTAGALRAQSAPVGRRSVEAHRGGAMDLHEIKHLSTPGSCLQGPVLSCKIDVLGFGSSWFWASHESSRFCWPSVSVQFFLC